MKFFQSLLVLILLGVACNNSSHPLDSFFDQLEKNIGDKKNIEKFKTSPIDSIEYYFISFEKEYFDAYKIPKYNKMINNWLNYNKTNTDFSYRTLIVIFSFHKYLNNLPIDIEQVQFDIQRASQNLKNVVDKQQELFEKENFKIILENNHKWNLGDTLNIILPIEIQSNGRKSTYFRSGYPLTLDYSSADDTLNLKGILMNKNYENYLDQKPNTADSMDLVFKIKILELSDTNIYKFVTKYKIGEEFDLPLRHYGRPIE